MMTLTDTEIQLKPRVRHDITDHPSLQCSNRPLNEQCDLNINRQCVVLCTVYGTFVKMEPGAMEQ